MYKVKITLWLKPNNDVGIIEHEIIKPEMCQGKEGALIVHDKDGITHLYPYDVVINAKSWEMGNDK